MQKKLFLLLVCLVSLVACVNKKETKTRDTVRIDVLTEVPTLDPQLAEDTSSTRVSFDLFAGLVDFDQQNQVIPGMAESFAISADGKTYTFHLRPNLKFSDGSPITAADFVYSWRRLVNPVTASPYSYILDDVVNAKEIAKKEAKVSSLGVFAPNKDTFVVKLDRPNPIFPKMIILCNAYVVPKHVIEKYGASWTDAAHIVTSGAYVLKDHVVNGYMLAVKNPYYYDSKSVSIPKVKYLPYGEINATVPSYKSGGLDATFQNVPVDQYRGLRLSFPQEVHTVQQEAIYYYDFNMKDPEFSNNKKLRMALSMAIDRDILSKHVLMQEQKPLYSAVSTTIDSGSYANLKYEWESWPRNQQISEAKKLYKEAGFGPDNRLKIEVSYNTNDLNKKVALAISAMWSDVLGVEAVNVNQEWKTFLQSRHKGDFKIARDGWVADYDSVTSYTPLYTCGNAQNNSHYCNSQVDALFNQASNNQDPKAQVRLYTQALQLVMNDYPVIPLFQYTYTEMYKPYIKSYDISKNYFEHQQTKWMRFAK